MTSTGDPRLKTASWTAARAYWRNQLTLDPSLPCHADRCLLPGRAIRLGAPRGRDSLDVGHREVRDGDPRTEWTIADTRPEHARCNRSHGGRYGRAKQTRARAAPDRITLALDDW